MKKLLLLVFLLTIWKTDYSSYYVNPKSDMITIKIMQQKQKEERLEAIYKKAYLDKYEEVIDFIKEHEGFRTKMYPDINGIKTIGHGLVTKYIDKRFRDSITYEQSDSIVRAKIDKGIVRARKIYSDLNKFQYLTVSHLFYCKGEGGIKKHSIHKQLKQGYIDYNTLLYYSEYEVERKHYRKTRRFEYKLFYFNLEV